RAQTLEELPLPAPEQQLPLPEAESPFDTTEREAQPEVEPAVDSTSAEEPVPAAVGNADIQEMVAAEFSDSTIIAVIRANTVDFDVPPRALVALKTAGVSEQVIEAMLAAVEEQRRAAEPEPTAAQLAETQASVEYAKLTEMIERLAAQQE